MDLPPVAQGLLKESLASFQHKVIGLGVDPKALASEDGMKLRGFGDPFRERWVLLVFLDSVMVALAGGTAFLVWRAVSSAPALANPGYALSRWFVVPVLIGIWWALASLNNLYDIPSSRDTGATVLRILRSSLLGLAVYFLATTLAVDVLSSRFFLYFWIILLPFLIGWRMVYGRLSHVLFSVQRILIIGSENRQAILQLIQPAARLNYQIVGYVDNAPADSRSEPAALPLLGDLTDLPNLARSLGIHNVVLAMKQSLSAELVDALITCQAQGVQVSGMADLYEMFSHSVPVEHIDPAWALYAIQGRPVFSRLQLVGKRLLDLLIICCALPVLLMIIPAIAVAIRLDSPGTIFYRQIRVGRGNRLFSIIKFRTMVADAEVAGKPQWATTNDPRITRLGRFLRKTRLDELPQILNILRGEMSLVGPRPERPEFVAELEQVIPFYRTRLLVKPGLTGWAQIHHGYGNTVDDALLKLQYDFYYIRHWSLWRDICILFQTVAVVILFKGT